MSAPPEDMKVDNPVGEASSDAGGTNTKIGAQQQDVGTLQQKVIQFLHAVDFFPAAQLVDENNAVQDVKGVCGAIISIVAYVTLIIVLLDGFRELASDTPIVAVSRHTVADLENIQVKAPQFAVDINRGAEVSDRFLKVFMADRTIFEGYQNVDRPAISRNLEVVPCDIQVVETADPVRAYCPAADTDLEAHLTGDFGDDTYRFIQVMVRPCPYYLDSIRDNLIDQGIDPETYCLVNSSNVVQHLQV